MNRRKFAEKQKIKRIIDRAVEKSSVPGAPSRGTPNDSGVSITPGFESDNRLDSEGRVVRFFMLGVDALGDSRRELRVNGKKVNYYG